MDSAYKRVGRFIVVLLLPACACIPPGSLSLAQRLFTSSPRLPKAAPHLDICELKVLHTIPANPYVHRRLAALLTAQLSSCEDCFCVEQLNIFAIAVALTHAAGIAGSY